MRAWFLPCRGALPAMGPSAAVQDIPAMFGISLFLLALASAVVVGLAARFAMQGHTGHRIEDMGRLIGG